METIKSTPISISVHQKSDNAIFGETSTHVSVDDAGAGAFIVLTQCNDDIKPGVIKLGLDELEIVVKVARKLIKANDSNG